MKWNTHFINEDHAFLSPSQYHWINYSDDKLIGKYKNRLAAQEGSELHEFASMAIKKGVRLEKRGRNSLAEFVNDSIGHRMESEQILYYSPHCYGTADAISFRRKQLMIFDLKTGTTAASFMQLLIYAAIFCLEYKKDPLDLTFEFRIYQNGEIHIDIPDPKDVKQAMGSIIHKVKQLDNIISLEG